ncbi:MAG TPA: ATP-binding protein [Gemmatimonadales bacterium]|nr:ATP-binding protein [Gemmatimonadales bacterium]
MNLSLNVRLPLLIAGLLLAVIVLFGALAYRAAARGQITAERARLQTVAEQFAGLLSQEAVNAVQALTAATLDTAIVAFGRGNAASEGSARRALQSIARDTAEGGAGELRDSRGALLLSAWPTTRTDSIAAAGAPARPDSAAVGRLYQADGFTYYEMTAPLGALPDGPGHLIVRRRLGATPEGMRQVVSMIGRGSTLLLSNRDEGLWVDAAAPAESVRVEGVPGDGAYRRGGIDRIGARARIAGSPWILAAERPASEALSNARSLLRDLMLVGLAVLGFGALLGWLMSRRLTTPLRELTTAAEAVARGDLSEFSLAHARQDELGRLGDAFGTMVSRVKDGQAQLRASEEQYRLLFDLNPSPMWVYDRETLAFLAVNRAAVRRYGFSHDEFLGMSLRDIRPPEEVPRLLAAVAAGPRGSDPTRWRHRTKDGTLLDVELSAGSLRFAGRDAELVLAHDVTERNQLEARFRQAQKMEAVGRLAGGIAHDFNNILSAVIGYADLLVQDLPEDDPRRADAEEVREAGRRGAGLTRQLLVFSRQQVAERRIVDVNEIVSGLHSMLERIIGEDITLESRLAPDLSAVEADPGQIEQVIMNLAVNARDAMPDGGRLTIETAMIELDEVHARGSRSLPAGRYVMLAVGDTGIGIPREQQAQIFEPFFTTKEAGKGTGLGLSTVYGIVEQSGGSVIVYSEPGAGATFKVYLPAVEGAAAPPRKQAHDTRRRGRAEQILLVEDEPALLHVANEILVRQGYEVKAVGTVGEALAWCESHPGAIELLVTDVVMPGLNGRQLAERIREMRPAIKVLFMSGYTDDAVIQRGILEPGFAFLQKPFSAASLAERVSDALAG